MTYGLYDADLPYYPTPFYNLELMKLSSYYKHKREIVGLSSGFSPNKYGHFIVRQDFYNPNSIPFSGKNVEYGGRAFDGDKYKPLPLEIEVMRPDISLYSNALPKGKFIKEAVSTMRRAEHLRLSLDGKTIWKDFKRQIRYDTNAYGIIFHDYDLNKIDGVLDFIKANSSEWIKRKDGNRIGIKFPVQIYNMEDFLNWLQIKPMGYYYSLHYNGLIDDSYLSQLVEINNEYHTLRQVSINITNSFTNEQLINGGIQRILRNIINLRTQCLFFPLIYDENQLIDNDWKQVMKLICRYNKHLVISQENYTYRRKVEPYETLYSYCKRAMKNPNTYKEDIFSKESMRSIFQFVRENNYDLFKDFYEYRGGEVKYDR